MVNVAPRGWLQCLHHTLICSSPRKSSIVFQVKTMSSHQRLAGMAKWIIPPARRTLPAAAPIVMASPQHAHDVSKLPSPPSMARIPKPSHTHEPKNDWPRVRTRKGVGTAHSGLAISTSRLLWLQYDCLAGRQSFQGRADVGCWSVYAFSESLHGGTRSCADEFVIERQSNGCIKLCGH